MEYNKEKFVRFYDGHSPKQNPVFKATAPLLKSEGKTYQWNKVTAPVLPTRKNGPFYFGKFNVFSENGGEPFHKRILDPGGDIYLQWSRVFLFSCFVALFVDPLFFYSASVKNVDGNSMCIDTDLNLGITLTCFRTVADVLYITHIIIKFRTAYVSPKSRVFGRGELVMDPKRIARRYLRNDFVIDLLAALPLPQIVIWFIIPAVRSSHADHTNNTIVLIVLLQYVPRLYLIFPLSSQLIKATGVVTKTAWAGAAYNLLLYMLASHVLGASWYLLSIERQARCWKSVCKNELTPLDCNPHFLGCDTSQDDDRIKWVNSTVVFTKCDPQNSEYFNYGIFEDALTKNVASSNFLVKYCYCLWWGLQNLSSYGQTLSTSTYIGETSFAILIAIVGLVLFAHLIGNMQSTSTYIGETSFAILIAIVGLVLFAHLIGNMQTYLQSITVRLEEWRLKRRDTEEWMRHRQLPEGLQERVRRFVQYKWLATRGVDEESILQALPTDLRRDIRRHLCLDLVRRVPFFSQMDDQLLDAICERLVSSLSTQDTYIVREDDPVTEMLFIIRGRLESSTTNGGRTGFFNSITLSPGDFCGEELLAWALHPKSTLNHNLPSSTRTVKALVEVEAFALRAEDLKFVANQFRRLHSKKLQHTFRFYSHHWRTWATCFIQAAWRRYKKRLMAKTLSMNERYSFSSDDNKVGGETGKEDDGMSHANIGVTILASRFATNTRKGALKMKDVEMSKLQKPDEPDFSREMDDDLLL